jgi:hypothetical protein
MSHALTLKATVRDNRIALLDEMAFHRGVKKLGLGEGESLVVRIEREADAKRHHQLRFLFGFVYKQVSEYTGYPIPEVDAMFRGLFMPADVETLSLMSYEQMADYIPQCEAYAAETIGVSIVGPESARRIA